MYKGMIGWMCRCIHVIMYMHPVCWIATKQFSTVYRGFVVPHYGAMLSVLCWNRFQVQNIIAQSAVCVGSPGNLQRGRMP